MYIRLCKVQGLGYAGEVLSQKRDIRKTRWISRDCGGKECFEKLPRSIRTVPSALRWFLTGET